MPFTSKALVTSKCLSYGHGRFGTRRRHSLSCPSTRNQTPLWPQNPRPSPHEILGIEAGKPYNKERFRRLIKLYHPDVHGQNPLVNSLARATRLERYHLIIAANELLSDPSKRKMYEMYDVGWAFKNQYRGPPTPNPTSTWPGSGPYTSAAQDSGHAGWTGHCATMRQEPIYMSNGGFAILLLFIAMGGAITQHERAKKARLRHKTLELAFHDSILMGLQDIIFSSGDKQKDERVLEFLARRHLGLVRTPGHHHTLESGLEDNICRH
ncbi:J domain-containing protein [Fusarium falciforme]|uniref:J domain-containing protein n=1 Tax=Fusarium falciforme TaxID=195108 RepID=UPI0023009ACF|nr:J domain-containing protein [Fusarium falciforme]WAO96336.1 J domain-containing protein [Fusarium falciforme]